MVRVWESSRRSPLPVAEISDTVEHTCTLVHIPTVVHTCTVVHAHTVEHTPTVVHTPTVERSTRCRD